MDELRFDSIQPKDNQVQELYDLLSMRQHGISHQKIPTFEEHQAFVKAHPYRCWYLIYDEQRAIGSFYLTADNSLGINLIVDETEQRIQAILAFVKEQYTPLPAITSLRAERFSVNVPASNDQLKRTLETLNARILQITYTLD